MPVPRRLYVFDMDGTLLPNTSGSYEIAKLTGTVDMVARLEANFDGTRANCVNFARELHENWGVLDSTILQSAFNNSSKLKNIKKTLESIAERGHVSCMITLAPNCFANQFYDYGFDHIFSSSFPASHQEAFDPEGILVPEDKLHLAQKLAHQLGVNFGDTVAFGDSISDKVLMDELTETVAVNGDHHINHLCKHRYKGECLWEAYELTHN